MSEGTKPKLTIESQTEDQEQSREQPNVHSQTLTAHKMGQHARKWFQTMFAGHTNACLGGLVGFLIAILVFAIGILKTLFVVLCVFVGIGIGQYLDGDPKIVALVSKLFGND